VDIGIAENFMSVNQVNKFFFGQFREIQQHWGYAEAKEKYR
jgi:hypothetical protein